MRSTNRLLAALLGVLLLVAGLLVALEVVFAGFADDPLIIPYDDWYGTSRRNSWSSGGVRVLGGGIAALGLILVVLQLVPRRPTTLAIGPAGRAAGGGTELASHYVIDRRSLERAVRRAATDVDGVESARASLRPRDVRIRARSTRRTEADLTDRIATAVDDQLDRLELESRPDVRVKVQTRKGPTLTPDRTNRLALTVIGLVLLALGGYGLARSFDAFGDDAAAEPFLDPELRDWVGRNDSWFWPVVFAAALLVAFLAYRWLRIQLRNGPRAERLRIVDDADEIVVAPDVVSDALADDIEAGPVVVGADARALSLGEVPEVAIDVAIDDDTTLVELRDVMSRRVLPRLRAALETETVAARISVSLAGPHERTVE